jgi:hypothetical protein
MCFDIRKKDSVASIATKDIIAYKVLKVSDGVLYSPYQSSFHWTAGKLEMVGNFRRLNVNGAIFEGFHCLRSLAHAKDFKKDGYRYTHYKIFQMIIPKGALYWINSTQIVSDQVKLVSDKPFRQKRKKKN